MPFDPQFALSTMLPLAEAAYDLQKLPKDWTLIAPIQPDNFGFLAERNGVVVVSIRGTEMEKKRKWWQFLSPDREWLEDFDGLAVPNQLGKGMVHQGFQDQYLKLRASILAALAQVKLLGDIWFTGHSLGGPLATLAASDPENAGRKRLTYTWASPRLGWRDYADWFDALNPDCYRIANEWDVVPRVPPSISGYKHVGREILIDGGRPPGDDSLKYAHNLELSYRPGVQKLIPPTPSLLKAA
jgi:predicted lipase